MNDAEKRAELLKIDLLEAQMSRDKHLASGHRDQAAYYAGQVARLERHIEQGTIPEAPEQR